MAEPKLTLEQRVEALELKLNTSSIQQKSETDIKKEELQALYVRRGNAKSSIDEKSDWNKGKKESEFLSESDYVRGLITVKQAELKELETKITPERVIVTNTNMGGM